MTDHRYHIGRYTHSNADLFNRLLHMTSPPALPDQTDVTIALYKSVIGPVNQSYYLGVFAHFDGKGKAGILWHWPAFFSAFNWLVFRKMWGMAAGFSGLALFYLLAVYGFGKLVFGMSETTLEVLTGMALLFSFVLPGLYANAAYYRFCERTINSVLVTGVDAAEACGILAGRASTRRRLLGLVLLNVVVMAMLVMLVAWVTGAYRDGKLWSMSAKLPSKMNPDAAAVNPSALTKSDKLLSVGAISLPVAPSSAAEPEAKLEAVLAPQNPASMPTLVLEPALPPAVPEPVSSAARPVAQQYFIQVGAYANLQNARKTMTQLEAMGLDAGAAPVVVSDGRLTRIRVGPFNTRAEARKAADQIKAQGLPALFVKL